MTIGRRVGGVNAFYVPSCVPNSPRVPVDEVSSCCVDSLETQRPGEPLSGNDVVALLAAHPCRRSLEGNKVEPLARLFRTHRDKRLVSQRSFVLSS